MPLTVESDGSRTVTVNLYSDPQLLRFAFPDLVFDAPGAKVFSSEKSYAKGEVLTLRQTKSGYNLEEPSGVLQFFQVVNVPFNIRPLAKLVKEPLPKFFRACAFLSVMGKLPADAEPVEFAADLILMEPVNRFQAALDMDPERTLHAVLKVIHSFSNRAAFASYSELYRSKLLAVESKFLPSKKFFQGYELDDEDPQGSLLRLLSLFA